MPLSRLRSRLQNLGAKLRGDTAGNVAVIFAIAIIPLVGAVGAAVDYSKAGDVKSALQGSLDSAVLGGVTQTAAKQVASATAMFTANYQNRFATDVVPSFTTATNSLSGTVSSKVPTSFLGVFGISAISVSVTATAVTTAGAGADVCILLVNQLKSQALLVNSGAVITAPTCEIHVQTAQNPAAMFNATLGVKRICVKGSTVVKNGGAAPPVETSCDTISNPFAGKLPAVTSTACTSTNQVYNPGSVTLNPGVFCGSTNFNGSGTLTFNPGLYVIKSGGMTFNSGWTITGTGVTFYLVDQNATLTFNGGVKAQFAAPTTGTYANILMFEPDGLSNSNLPINGSSGNSFTGLIYLPSRDVTINSVSNVSSNNVNMVFSTLILNATNWSIAAGALPMQTAGTTGKGARLSK